MDKGDFGNFSKSSPLKNLSFGSNNAAHEPFFDLVMHRNGNDVKINGTTTENTSYDPQVMRPKSIICSEVVSRTRLTIRDANLENSVRAPVQSDEAFFEKLKQRINGDREKLGTSKAAIISPKRASKASKRRGLFNNESLNLMKKFRQEILSRTDRLSEDHGIFSMASRNNGDEENFHATNSPKEGNQITGSNQQRDLVMDNMSMNKNVASTDGSSQKMKNFNRTSPSSSTSILPWDQHHNY